MQVLTPSGYVSPAALANGAAVCAFDENNTGQAIINTVENIDFVDYQEWCRWWSVEDEVPSYDWYRINGERPLFFREQSIWRNGSNVCHVRDLVVGDVIHDDHDNDITITSIDVITDNSLIWYRFDISGDHSYIVDGLTVHNASRFWVGGTGTWDSSTTTHWASTTGGSGGQTVPGSADAVTLDGSSGGGTVTMNFGGTVTIQSLTMGAFVGTWDNSVNNNNFTLSANTGAFSTTGSAVRTVKVGSATYSLTATANGVTPFNILLATNLTYTGGSETWAFTGVTQVTRLFQSASTVTIGTLTINTSCGCVEVNQGCTINTINVNPGTQLMVAAIVLTTTNLNINGTSAGPQPMICGSAFGSQGSISIASGTKILNWCAIKDTIFTGGATFKATNSFDLGNNTGITITPPFMAAQPIIVARGAPY